MRERNIRLVLEYDGTNYHGWQRQTNAVSIQEILEGALEKLVQTKLNITGAGRTDAGVHARGQVANFKVTNDIPLHKIRKGINAYLPSDIVVKEAEEVSLNFNARFDARRRVYQYYILQGMTALYRNLCWQYFQKLDASLLQPMADVLTGEHNFSAFTRATAEVAHKNCLVYESSWIQDQEFLVYRIVANRFLHGMVRAIVGTMVDVAKGRLSFPQFKEILLSGNRSSAGGAAPARGLFLEEVIYEV